MRCACIDVGSNTTAMLVADVADGELTVVGTHKIFTMLGTSTGPSGIDDEKIAEVTGAVEELLAIADSLDCANVELVATHVVREAHNGHELTDRVARVTGRSLRVIDGHQEARYSFIGAVGGLHRLRSRTVAVDVGGGSTEVAWCDPGAEPVTASFHVGSAALQRIFLLDDPPTNEQLASARAFAAEELAALRLPGAVGLALAVGGGASTARQLTGGVIDRASIARVLELTSSTTCDALARQHAISADRARLLPAGLVILDALVELIGSGLEVGRGGLREGLLLDRF